ncbi:hypothetical protein TNCV_1210371 [Trichonephila clavipes]|nr:hypothetical protein TNCV_1210371 [Trichonephila clavipes]
MLLDTLADGTGSIVTCHSYLAPGSVGFRIRHWGQGVRTWVTDSESPTQHLAPSLFTLRRRLRLSIDGGLHQQVNVSPSGELILRQRVWGIHRKRATVKRHERERGREKERNNYKLHRND